MSAANVDLGSIASWTAHAGETGSGTYLLTGYGEHTGTSGQTYLKLILEDASGRATGFAWPEARASVTCSATPAPVSVSGTVQQFQGHAQIKVHSLASVGPDQLSSATALLPRNRCPEAALPALDQLTRLEGTLPDPLDGFLRRVLLDRSIGMPFLRCRASVAHHHAFVGGLLVHSTEMLDLAFEMTRRILPKDEWSPYLAQLGYLLHDLGKVRTVGEQRRPRYALIVRHEFVSLEMLAPHLAWLEQRNAELAMALRYLLAYLATPAAARKVPEHAAVEVVEKLDQWSAAEHNQRDLAHLLQRNRLGHGGEAAYQPQQPQAPTRPDELPERWRQARANAAHPRIDGTLP